jgi:hypothetical protein
MENGKPVRNQHSVDAAGDEYRRVCLLAVLAFLLGLASIGIFLGPLLLVLPLAGLGIGLLALAKINASAGNLSGRTLAMWGIALALVFGVAGTVRPVVYNHLIIKQGTSFATRWLQMLARGDSEQALTLIQRDARMRMAPVDSRGEPILGESLEQDILGQFQQDPLVSQIGAEGNSSSAAEAKIELVELAFSPRVQARKTTVGLVMHALAVTDRRQATGGDVSRNGDSDADGLDHYVYLELEKTRSTGHQHALWSVLHWKSAATLAELAETP